MPHEPAEIMRDAYEFRQNATAQPKAARIGRVRPSRSAEVAPQVLDSVDEARREAIGFPGGADVGYPAQQLAQHDRDLPPGQVRAEAEVRAGSAEADMRVRGPPDVETQRVDEHRLVAIV